MFSEAQWNIVRYCAEECRRQSSGELSVGWMLSAWEYTMTLTPKDITPETIQHIGTLVEPTKNRNGIRRVPVFVGDQETLRPELVPQALESLCAHITSMEPLVAYIEYEKIHPFIDGNGRSGKCLLNLLGGTLEAPIFPPRNIWGRDTFNP